MVGDAKRCILKHSENCDALPSGWWYESTVLRGLSVLGNQVVEKQSHAGFWAPKSTKKRVKALKIAIFRWYYDGVIWRRPNDAAVMPPEYRNFQRFYTFFRRFGCPESCMGLHFYYLTFWYHLALKTSDQIWCIAPQILVQHS